MYPQSLMNLIEKFRLLPGVGEKTAERYALLISDMDEEEVQGFAEALMDVKKNLKHCHICGNLSDQEECSICKNSERNHRQIFVVQSPKDVIAMERTGEYKGVYHVLNGLISMSKGIGPDSLNIDQLIKRAEDCDEVILATNTTMDGETTAMYLGKVIKERCPDTLVTRIAHGLPAGGLLDYADEITLSHALTGRKQIG